MEYKIVFSDIDGTLLNKDKDLSAATMEAVKKLKDKVPFILVSARMPAAMRHIQNKLEINNLPLICYNGGLVLVDNAPVSSTEIPLSVLESLHGWNRKVDLHLSLYNNDEWYVPQMDQWALREQRNTKIAPEVKSNAEVIERWKAEGKGAHKIMAMGAEEHIDRLRDFLAAEFPGDLHLYRSKDTYLEIAPSSISKLTAIELLLEKHYRHSLEAVVAFGDNYNDVEMLAKVGYGVAVGNARPEALKAARTVTDTGLEDGVAKGLTKIFRT